jgi:hypothetical protein
MKELAKSHWSPPDTVSSREADVFDHKHRDRVDFLNPIAMSQLQTAVKAKKKTVILNGEKFDITYGIIYHSKVTEDYEQIKLKRSDGSYAPMAYVRLSKILAYDFEEDKR